ncbi:MAG: peptidylprolyl isomerase [Bacteroidales bacterium]|nr:peptidylprolyl isomerase [Bacteroidales bacterium]
MINKSLLFLVFAIATLTSCKTSNKQNEVSNSDIPKNSFVIETSYGQMKGRLFDETPLHRDNFIKLVNEGYFDSLLFHRVIENFMIQGGDPDSKFASKGQVLGNGGPEYTIPAEFNSKLIHKKGALAAARQGDNVNPTKASSGSQFYIVQGTVYDSLKILQMEQKIIDNKISSLTRIYLSNPANLGVKNKLDSLNTVGDRENLRKTYDDIVKKIREDNTNVGFSSEQIKTYTTIGGTPHLDGDYTVFGEIYEGLDVLDSIAKVKGDRNNRPLEDIRFTIKMLQ